MKRMEIRLGNYTYLYILLTIHLKKLPKRLFSDLLVQIMQFLQWAGAPQMMALITGSSKIPGDHPGETLDMSKLNKVHVVQVPHVLD